MQNKRISSIHPALVFLLLAVLFGGYIRLNPILTSSFPLNDGGLFYTMVLDLQENGYRIPETTSYNQQNFPYAYPPLSFYMAGLLSDLFGWGLLDIFRILPAIFSTLTIPAFYILALKFTEKPEQAGIAALIFALLPISFDWLIMGGGLTRAPAFFFALLTLHRIYLLYTRQQNADIVWTAVLAALTVLCHPERALHTAASAMVFYVFLNRSKTGAIRSFAVAGLTILLTLPWWFPVISNHGVDPFLSAGQTGLHNVGGLIQLFKFDFTHEFGLQSIATLALLGIFLSVSQRKYFLPVWLAVIFVSEPRSAPLYSSICVALLAVFSINQFLAFLNQQDHTPTGVEAIEHPFSSLASKITFGVLFAQWMLSALVTTQILTNTTTLSDADRTAFNWISDNTPPESNFLVLSGIISLTDPTAEWFPSLTERVSVATVQGFEWDRKHNFDEIVAQGRAVQECVYQDFSCLQSWMHTSGFEIDYIYIRKLVTTEILAQEIHTSALEDLLITKGLARSVYQSHEVAILELQSMWQDGN